MKKILKLETCTMDEISRLFGRQEENIRLLEEAMQCELIVRGDEIVMDNTEEKNQQVEDMIRTLLALVKQGKTISQRDIMYSLNLAKNHQLNMIDELYQIKIARTTNGKLIYPKTLGQKEYYQALKHNDVVFGIGPAGTGKTYLAVVFAVQALKNNEVQKIILTRPAVEAGESLGFLPGDLKEKVDPYLRPLYDALYDMLGQEKTERYIEKGIIEIAPLAYMRGRTLEDAYVILDEAQNTTDAQMKMFLTRLGFHSKMIITGDITQIDLPKGVVSGLKKALHILKDVKGIRFVYLTTLDVVRHPVVQRIIERYENDEKNHDDINC
ncbi:PhoH family protein [Massilimicrobiota timonensis]|uniref:PhoH family protein n=1 Tax=Massilimicrobiota timonensis TaxID=1776392 RepID=UPI001961708C|nr:PhoH family protein [Massilimicrobiota timonensis]MBM6965119.1 PhoH family protein [Massilimicrobiota timonensis]